MTVTTLPGHAEPASPSPTTPSSAVNSRALEESISRAFFFVSADADPNMMMRLIEPFAKLGLVPERVFLSTEEGTGDELSADLRLAGADRHVAHLLEKALSGVIGVRSVIVRLEEQERTAMRGAA